jgi:hypothetical protein
MVIVFAAGYFNGWMDYIKKFNLDSESWENKWKWFPVFPGDRYTKTRDPYVKRWYYFGLHSPEFKEAFPFSSTILVFLTDEWHGYKWKMFLCYEIVLSYMVVHYENISLWWIIAGVLILKTIRGIGFTLKYDKK